MGKKDNHYVPKCLLKRWLVDHEELKGLHVLDIKTMEINFHVFIIYNLSQTCLFVLS